jgi:predicted amidophosphoribosyltransferase
MGKLICKHCGRDVAAGEETCAHCGMPLPPDLGKNSHLKFKLFFIALIVFCAAMILWLPRDLMQYLGK